MSETQLTIRDQFAIAAMPVFVQSLIASREAVNHEELAVNAYSIADQMMKVRQLQPLTETKK